MERGADWKVGDVIWQPDAAAIESANLTRFMRLMNRQYGLSLASYSDIHAFSIERPAEFWSGIWDFGHTVGEKGRFENLSWEQDCMAADWFPEARLNFAENLLRNRGEAVVLSAWNEGGKQATYTGRTLFSAVVSVARALQREGVKPGDRVVGILPNIPEAVIAMLATTSIGGIWSVSSPEMGATAIVDRFSQIEPTVLFATTSSSYAGKQYEVTDKIREVAGGLPGLRRTVLVNADNAPTLTEGEALWSDWVAAQSGDPATFHFERFSFDHPLCIVYSSGTTGKPKCIVHKAGGVLLKALSDQLLQNDVQPGDSILRYTSTGWMMWYTAVLSLLVGAKAVLYDGSPHYPDIGSLLDIAEAERVTLFSVAPAIIEQYSKSGLVPREDYDLSALRCVSAGGMRLHPETYVYIYASIKSDIHVTSPSGGTDILSFFVGGNPIGPCYIGEIQAQALGVKLGIYGDDGRPVPAGAGELVCTMPVPSMPLGFWGDDDNARYKAAYFSRFPGVWAHGDLAEVTERGSIVIHGRSDATLKANGIRIGTAEIYSVLTQFPQIVDAVAVDQDVAGRSRIALVLTTQKGEALSPDLENTIRQQIRVKASPRHVPEAIFHVPDLPRTATGKIAEMAVRRALNNQDFAGMGTLVNPEIMPLLFKLAMQ